MDEVETATESVLSIYLLRIHVPLDVLPPKNFYTILVAVDVFCKESENGRIVFMQVDGSGLSRLEPFV